MTEKSPENLIIPVPIFATGWWYQEFRGPSVTTATPGAPESNPGGISAAQTWLNQTIKPGTNDVFGMIDGQGTVRMFWYGTIDLVLPAKDLP